MNNQTLIEEITKLGEEWYRAIGPSLHKDRDCHWYIETKWSYGQPSTYEVQHWGYILDDIKIECSSYEVALIELKKRLIKEIKEYKKFTTEYDT
jgi:hypothetical protein